ncbi:MAG: DUF2804 domain-containing protein [Erysipelotrichaceae bacterium]|nr:DUF2804 domain-containing protein [Erysipelotrichaceae bacterium]MBQ7890485.1 DUF2804 domain-containing protein [Erysipelotrichaceae bacterium]
MMQHEITRAIPLLDEKGNLTEAGYAKKLLPIYDRTKVKGGKTRLKEWDYYYVGNDQYGVCLTIDDNYLYGLDSITFLWFGENPWEVTQSPMRIMPRGNTGLPETSVHGVSKTEGKGYSMKFDVHRRARVLEAHMDNFKDGQPIDVHIALMDEPEESMVICTPFDKEAHFYYNQKINCMRAKGTVKIGEEEYRFEPESSFGVLDWGRGVWTYENTWYWGSASGLVDGVDFGFNIGYGFGDTSKATENMLFYKGKAHKLSEVEFHIPMKEGKEDYLSSWTFTSNDGRFEMDFVPVINRSSLTDLKILKSDQNQVFGRFTGTAVLDDGTKLEVKDLMGFAEKVANKW